MSYSFYYILWAGRSAEDRRLRKAEAAGSNPAQSTYKFTDKSIGEYLSFLELKGVTKYHLKQVEIYLKNYKKYILSVIDKQKSVEYFKELQRKSSVAYYKKQMFQLRRFLKFLKVDWADEITLPADPNYNPIRISSDTIKKTIDYFKEDDTFIRLKAVILVGCSSGLRSTEIYKLTENDIDLNNNMILVKHDPKNNHTTKTKKTRVTFFSNEAKKTIEEYIIFFHNYNSGLRTLFAQKSLSRKFRNAPIRVKDLRKFFSQEWDRRGGPTSIKKILMGHSLKGDVDLCHYNAQSEDDLKKIYDKVTGDNNIL